MILSMNTPAQLHYQHDKVALSRAWSQNINIQKKKNSIFTVVQSMFVLSDGLTMDRLSAV